MNSISQKTAAVKWGEKKKLSNRLARKMSAAGFEKRGNLMSHCGDIIGLKVCPNCGNTHIAKAQLCRDKMCPTCAWRLSIKRYAEMCKTFDAIEGMDKLLPLFWTVTVRNCAAANISQTLKSMSEDWNRLMARKTIKPLFKGWARAVEITYNRKADTFHPHYHIIVLASKKVLETMFPLARNDKQRVAYLMPSLGAAWKEAARLDYEPITDLRAIASKHGEPDNITAAILETFKYSVKSSELDQMPLGTFRCLVNGLAGKRMTAYGGVIKEARRLMCLSERDELTEADNNLEGEQQQPCTRCGSQEMRLMIFRWASNEQQYQDVAERMTH